MLSVNKGLKSNAFVLSCPDTIRFISLKNRKHHKKELLDYLVQEKSALYEGAEAYAKQLEAELRCFIPLSLHQLKTLCQQKRIHLRGWQGYTVPDNQELQPSGPGIWVRARQLPAHAYLETGLGCAGHLPELTRVQEAGWHLACYHYALRCAAQWHIKGPPGVLTLSAQAIDQTLVLPKQPGSFLLYWLKKHPVAHVETPF